jgi:hypothetical protein
MNRSLILVLAIAAAWALVDKWTDRPVKYTPGVLVAEAPLQEAVPDSVFGHEEYILTRRARFVLRARVLSTERYWLGREADLAPLDLALGWNVMSDQSLLDQIRIRQGGRWYYTRWDQPLGIPEQQVSLNSSNMHMIPARSNVARKLKALRPGDVVYLEGFLVDVDHPSGWHWRTSMSRSDIGAGACEIVYVENVTLETEKYLSN